LTEWGRDLSGIWLVCGIAVEAVALLLIPFVLLLRKEPPSTVAWILALIFLPGIGATLFLLFGRDRMRLQVQWKRDADRRLADRKAAVGQRRAAHRGDLPGGEPRGGAVSTAQDAEAAAAHGLSPLPDGALPVDRELFRLGAALTGEEPTTGNGVALLVDGDATYAAIGAAIDAAERHVHAEYYLIRNDATADWLRERLVAAAARGVEVKLLVDGYGSFWLARRWLRSLRRAGVRVAVFLPARRLFFLQPMNLRNHRKTVVVDGAVGFTGGVNIGDEYRGKRAPWRDIHLRLTGPCVAQLAQMFEQDWRFATGEELPRAEAHAREGDALADATVSIVRSGPDIEGPAREAIHRLFFSAITLARSRVYVTTPYFIPDRSILVALQSAALRGVDVRLLFPSRSNHKIVWLAGRSFYAELLQAGVSIYEYGPGMIHAKTMIVDGSLALVGSANMDLRSFRLNCEVHAVVRDDRTASELGRRLEADLAVSNRIEIEAFGRRSRALRVLENAARLLSPLM
jgi:cardiolipin synthase A/B